MLSYPAKIKKENGDYIVSFVDFENISTYGKSMEEALKNAEEALNGCLESDFERNFNIAEPSLIKNRNVRPIPVKPHIAVAIMLRKLRAGKPQMEIAKKLNISYQVYQRLENPKKSNPTLKTLEKIARIYGRQVNVEFVSSGTL